MKQNSSGCRLQLMLLAAFFFMGALAGQFAVLRSTDETISALGACLRPYRDALLGAESPLVGFGALLRVYLPEALLAFLSAYTLLGTVILPLTAAYFGFSLSFSVCALTAVFGGSGLLLSLALFGLRALLTVPCFFLLAVPAWRASRDLTAAYLGKSRVSPAPLAVSWRRRCLFVAALLTTGVCAERYLTPLFLKLLFP
ncbi:MAG: hypothetical protein IKN53_01810 [Oscillibacter sp.]|nr:hypothetical protein [Oscillibacter sp.]